MKKVLLVINPNAGKMKSRTAMYEIVSRLCKAGYQVCVQVTQHRGHAAELAREAWRNSDLCICCGGDGTLNEIITGMMRAERKIPIGYIPAGTTNDFAQSMNIPLSVKRATDNIINHEPIKIDIGKLGDRFFTYIASFGAFTAASYNTPQSTKNTLGHFAYILEGIRDLSSLHPYKAKIFANGTEYDGEYIFGAVSNSTSIGGIVKLNNSVVDMKDGLFELVLVKCPKNAVEMSKIIHGITVSDFSSEMFEFFKSSKIEVEMDEVIPWTLDGEYFEGANRIEISNLNEAIEIRK